MRSRRIDVKGFSMLHRILGPLAGAVAFALLAHAAALLPLPAAAHSEHEGHGDHAAQASPGFPAGEPGAGKSDRTIKIVMQDADGTMTFSPSNLDVRRGEQVKFVLTNDGTVDHEFLIDTPANNAVHKAAMSADPEMQHDEPNGRRLKPGETAELLWRFTKAGTFEIACLIPGHFESGMKGEVSVK
jgi:uncharacterized cupredoxin-like copper-binding protein